MKRIFVKLALVLLISSLAITFAACDLGQFGIGDSSNTPHTHAHSEKITKAPTCTETGVKTFTCECGDSYTQDIAALGHTFDEWKVTKEATCTEKGENTRTCACGEIEKEEIPMVEHIWNAATCTTPKTCSVCHTTEGEALGHSWIEATCTDPKNCSVCHTTEGEALGHSWIEATCTEPKSCSVQNSSSKNIKVLQQPQVTIFVGSNAIFFNFFKFLFAFSQLCIILSLNMINKLTNKR